MNEQGKRALIPKLRFPEFRDAGGWEIKPFAKLFSIGNGRDHKHLAPGDVPVYGSGGYMRSVDEYLYDGESVCIGRKGTINSPMFLTGKFWTVDTLFYTHSFNQCLPKFIFSIFQSIDWLKHNEAGGVPSLSKTNIEKIETAIPLPAEQQKIIDCLSSLDELFAAQTQKLEALKIHKKGLMQQLFPREGETQPRLRFPEFQGAGEWGELRLDELARYENGKAHENDISVNGRYIVVNSKFISTEGAVRKFTNEGFCVADKGDVLMVLSDVPNGRAIAKCYFVESDDLYTVNQRICRIQPTKVNGRFLFYVLDRNSYFLDFDDGIKQTNLRKEDVVGFPLCVPPQLAEQHRIADCLTTLDDLIAAQTQKLDALKTHKKGLMQQLFLSLGEVEA